MTRQEAAAVLAVMSAAWPNFVVPEETALVWAECLATTDAEIGMRTARKAIDTEQWFPSVARFHELRRAIEAGLHPAHHALEAGEPPPEGRAQVQRLAAEARKALKAAKGRQHNHKGPDPCPVCGGVKSA